MHLADLFIKRRNKFESVVEVECSTMNGLEFFSVDFVFDENKIILKAQSLRNFSAEFVFIEFKVILN